jgi:hypothetical protein
VADPAIERIAAALRPFPDVDPSAKAGVLVAVAAARVRDAEEAARRRSRRRTFALGALAAGLVAVAAMAAGGTLDLRRADGPDVVAAASPPMGAVPASLAAAAAPVAGEAVTVTVQLVVRAPAARAVSVVGDFTGWEKDRVPMTRDPASGLWSATVMVRPGRHVYAFVADDSIWMRDPRAPVVEDADFGRPGSLLLVARP